MSDYSLEKKIFHKKIEQVSDLIGELFKEGELEFLVVQDYENLLNAKLLISSVQDKIKKELKEEELVSKRGW